jgi:IPT/TIG domain
MTQRYPAPITATMVKPVYVPVFTYNGGTYGDETLSESNVVVDDRGIGDYTPRNLLERKTTHPAGDPDYVSVIDVGVPRGWIEPNEPYNAPPVSPTDDPTITSLTPNTGVSGGSPIWVTITGTKFTKWSQVETGNVYTPYSRYVSATRIDVLMDPRSSAGVVVVKVVDHNVKSGGSNFTFT